MKVTVFIIFKVYFLSYLPGRPFFTENLDYLYVLGHYWISAEDGYKWLSLGNLFLIFMLCQ